MRVLISGVTGQDGSYLTDYLLDKGYDVYGIIRRVSTPNLKNIEHNLSNDKFHLIDGDLTDLPSLIEAYKEAQPDLAFNLAAQSIAENEFIPLLKTQKLCLRTFKNLWDELKLKNTVKILQIDGVETEVIEVKSNQIRALGYTAGMGNWKKIIQISRHKYNGKMVRLNQKYGSVCATPYHSVYDIEGNLCDAINNPVLLPMRKINYYSHLKEEVKIKVQGTFESDNDWFWSTKKLDVKFPKVVNKDTLEEFLRFCAAYIAEGCCHSRDNGWQDVVIISNNDKSWLESVEKDIKRVIPGISCYYTENKKENYDSTWNMCISDKTLYQIIVSLCGKGSINKRIPDFVFKLKEKYKIIFINKLIEGDGCVENRKLFNTIRYTTVSKELATGLCLLLSLLNRDYTCRMSEDNNEDHNAVYFIREVKSYQLQQGIEQRKLDLIDYDGYVYDIAVEGLHNFTVGVGNIVVHNSFVATSWTQPILTCNVTGMGAVNFFEAARLVKPDTKVYQASSSEMFSGKIYPQNEKTPFEPRSPYGAAKLFAHKMVDIYRKSYDMFIVGGILFNHETEFEFMPVIIREKDSYEFDIKPLSDVIEFDKTKKEYQEKEVSGLQIWDKDGWVDITYASAYPHDIENDNKAPRMINSRMGINGATGSHVVFMADGSEKETKDIVIGDRLEKLSLPKAEWEMATAKIPNLCDEAEMLGMLVGDGYVPSNGNGAKFINSDEKLRNRFTELWGKVAGGKVNYYPSKSGFNPENTVGYLGLSGNNSYLHSLDLYTSDRKKRVPKKVLNASPQVQLAFLRGYNATDGLKKNKCTYEFKNFKTNSATLAMGLIYLIECTTKQKYNLTVEKPEKPWYHIYYSINLLSPTNNLEKEKQVKGLIEQGVGQRAINRITGISRAFVRKIQNGGVACIEHHMEQDDCEVKKIIEMPDYDGWFYDLTTTSGAFHAGIGKCHVHNSPRRGIEFVTQKIVDTIVRQKVLKEDICLEVGNIEACRDWSHAKDMCINLDVPILTPQGWKFHYELEENDEVINFNPGQNCMSRDKIKRVIYQKTEGDKVILKGRGVYLSVTPQHRVYYQQKSKNSQSGWSDWKVCTAKEFHDKLSDKVYRTKYNYRLPHFQDYKTQDIDVSDDVLYLLGVLLTEGCSHNIAKGGGTQVSISQSITANKTVWNKIKKCLDNLKLDYNEKIRNNGVTEWVFRAESSRQILDLFDGFDVHTAPQFIYSLSQRQAEVLFNSMMDCDGHWGGLNYKSSNYNLAVAFQTIAHLAGYRTTGVYKVSNGGGLVKNLSSCYQVGIVTKSKKYTYVQEVDLINDGTELVWCIETVNGTIITRDNECISISGNCRGMYLMLQQDKPKDYILSSGKTWSVRNFIDAAYRYFGEEARWFIDDGLPYAITNGVTVRSVPQFYRPNEVDVLCGDSKRAREELNWQPKYDFEALVEEMIESRIAYYKSIK